MVDKFCPQFFLDHDIYCPYTSYSLLYSLWKHFVLCNLLIRVTVYECHALLGLQGHTWLPFFIEVWGLSGHGSLPLRTAVSFNRLVLKRKMEEAQHHHGYYTSYRSCPCSFLANKPPPPLPSKNSPFNINKVAKIYLLCPLLPSAWVVSGRL